MGRSKTSKAFALPTVLIASIVLLTILAVSVTATAAVRTTLKNQYYIQLAQVAGESGVAYAKACLSANANVPQWTNAKPLTPATDCTGTNQLPGGNSDCPADPACSVTINDNVRSSFSVPQPTVDGNGKALTIPNNGYVDILRTSNGAVWRTYKQPSVQAAVVPDLCSGNATAARGWGAAIKVTQQDSIPSASTAQTISIANAAINAGSVYYRKDFNAGQAGTYDVNVYTPTPQDVATTYIDGIAVNLSSGALSTSQVSLTGGCHVMVTVLLNDTYTARASDFTASITRSGEATPTVITDTSWRVSAGDPTHFSENNYQETANAWEQAADFGRWDNTALPWGGAPSNWASVSGDSLAEWISTRYSTGGYNRPGNAYAWLRDTTPFTTTTATTIRVTNYCDDKCDLYLDGDQIMAPPSGSGIVSKSITVQPGTHTFGIRLYNLAAGNVGALLFAAKDLTNNVVVSRSNPNWDATTSWSTAASEPYSFDATFTPSPSVQSTANVRILLVAGGGSGGTSTGGSGGGGGGGAGGMLYNAAYAVGTGSYPVTVGSGGASVGSASSTGNNGQNSNFGTLRVIGGGGGGASNGRSAAGGSGGGAGYLGYTYQAGSAGASGQGNDGGVTLSNNNGGGGGGAGGNGGNTNNGGPSGNGGVGGAGIANSISGSSVTYAKGGEGGGPPSGFASGAANTGNGGSGVYASAPSGAGGSGIVVISYPSEIMTATGGIITTSGGNTIHTFKSNGTFTVTSTVAPLAFDTNVTPPFSGWTLSGGATYNGSTGEIALPGASANAYSPLMRVENASGMTVGASFYATTPAATFSPQGGFLLGTEYFAADLSPVNNSAGYQNNGCARGLTLNSLVVMPTTCSFAGGPNVKYLRVHYSGSSTYTSTGIKIKDPSTIFSQ